MCIVSLTVRSKEISNARFPRPKISGSLNHEVKGEFRWCGEQNNQNTHIPLAAAARNHQYILLGEGGRYQQLEERGRPKELHPLHTKTSDVSIRFNNAKANRILTFPSSL
jgi:hypothetical protein